MGRFRKQIKCNFLSIGLLKTAMEENVWRIYFEGMQINLKVYWYNNSKKKWRLYEANLLFSDYVLILLFFGGFFN